MSDKAHLKVEKELTEKVMDKFQRRLRGQTDPMPNHIVQNVKVKNKGLSYTGVTRAIFQEYLGSADWIQSRIEQEKEGNHVLVGGLTKKERLKLKNAKMVCDKDVETWKEFLFELLKSSSIIDMAIVEKMTTSKEKIEETGHLQRI